MQYPDDWITSNTPESEKAKEQLASLNSAESKLPIAIDAKAPQNNLMQTLWLMSLVIELTPKE